MNVRVSIVINGRRYDRDVEPRLLLVHFLRDPAALTGTKVGCDTSQCGACTVLLDGVAVEVVHVPRGAGRRLRRSRRSKGSRPTARCTRCRKRFWDKHGLQCGFCTPGMILAAHELLARNPTPTDERDPPRRSKATCAAAPAIRTSCAPFATRDRARRQRRGDDDDAARMFGSGIRRREDPRLITGDGALHRRHRRCPACCTPRCCAARTRTRASRAIDTAAAKSAPGVVAVYTGADIEGACKPMPCAWLRARTPT